MPMKIIFEAHATTLDNEAKVCSGWNDVALSGLGEQQAIDLGERYESEVFDAIFCPDLQRGYRTAQLAFPNIVPNKLFLDWRLRECDYGDMTLAPKDEVELDKINHLTQPFPNGESYHDALRRMKSFLDDLSTTKYEMVLIIGSRATHYGLDHWINGKTIKACVSEPLVWQPGWQYELVR